MKIFGKQIQQKQCSVCENFYPENQVKEICEHLRFCHPCYVEHFGSLDYEFVTDRYEFSHGAFRGTFIENVYVGVRGTHKDIERVLQLLSNKLRFGENPEKCFVEFHYRYYAANLFKVRRDPIPWTSEYMVYRERAHRTLKITLDGPLGQVKPINDVIMNNLGEPYKVKGPSIIQKLRGYEPLEKTGKLNYLMNMGKPFGLYLIDFGKVFSCLFPGIGEALFYREIRKSGGSRKESLAMSALTGVPKIPLFIVPCEQTLALYAGMGIVEAMGIALYSGDNQSKNERKEVMKNER